MKKRVTNNDLANSILRIEKSQEIFTRKLESFENRLEGFSSTQESLLSAILNTRNELKQDLKGTEARLDNKIDTKTDDIIALLRDFIHYSSAKYDNHDNRITKLEGAI